MVIQRKEQPWMLLWGFALFLVGLITLALLMQQKGHVDILTALGRLMSILMMLAGIGQIVLYAKTNQVEDLTVKIKDDRLFLNQESYNLKGAYLSVELEAKAQRYRVTLRLERKKEVKVLFENVVMDEAELKEFLALIRPYRKSDVCLKDVTGEFELMQEGFIIDGREILYNEIKSFQAVEVHSNVGDYVELTIHLKNSDIIITSVSGDAKMRAKPLFAAMRFRYNDFSDWPLDCPKEKKLNKFILILGPVAFALLFTTPTLFLIGAVMFYGVMYYIYRYSRNDSQSRMCRYIRELQKRYAKGRS